MSLKRNHPRKVAPSKTVLVWDSSFKRAYRKRVSSDDILKKKFWEAIEVFVNDPFDSRLKTHKLTGKLSGLWAFSIDYDCRVVFQFPDEKNNVLLIDIGSHDEVVLNHKIHLQLPLILCIDLSAVLAREVLFDQFISIG